MITAESSESDGVNRRTLETHLLISEVYKNKEPKELRLVRRTPKWAQYNAIMMAREPKDAPPGNDMGEYLRGFALLS